MAALKFDVFWADHGAQKGMDELGDSAENTGRRFKDANKEFKESAGGFDRASEAADGAENKFQGMASTLDGTTTSAAGFAKLAKGDVYGGLMLVGQGGADLAEGFNYTVIPAVKAMTSGVVSAAGRMKVAAAGTKAWAVATRVMTVAQWALNVAMRANPIGVVITLITLLAAGLVLAYRRSATFRAVVQGAFAAVQVAGRVMWAGLKFVFSGIAAAARIVGPAITSPFRAAFAGIRAAWNATVGGRGFSVPSWVPGIGGRSFTIPYMAQGGIVRARPGGVLAVLGEGQHDEAVVPLRRGGGFGGHMVLELRSSGNRLDRLLLEILREAIRVKGGDVQVVLGS